MYVYAYIYIYIYISLNLYIYIPRVGKTTASVEILRLWAKLGIKNILATADGNVAVDNIAMGLVKVGVKVR